MTATNDASYTTELSAEQKAHETSMDDILASIRRIIADDDALPLSRRARARVAAAPPLDAGPALRVAPVADAFVSLGQRLTRQTAPAEAEASLPPPTALAPKLPLFTLRRFAPNPEPTPENSHQQGLGSKLPVHEVSAEEASANEGSAEETLADEDAVNRAALREIPAQTAPVAPPLELRPTLAVVEKPAEPPSASVVTLVQPSAQAFESRLKISPWPFRGPTLAPAPAETAEMPSQTPSDSVAAAPVTSAARVENPPAAEAPPAGEEDSEPALLSPASGSRIGASFEALADSLLLRDPRIVERLTREMLRPMLKEWLDDHLPDVVERLVRAEIERVARGGG
jgi:cell pole-organizing protein PopZ